MSEQQKEKKRQTKVDTDGDRTPDEYDCQPNNSLAQDFKHIYGFSGKHDGKNVRTVMMNPDNFLNFTYEEGKLKRKRSGQSSHESFSDYKTNLKRDKENIKWQKKALQSKEKKHDVAIPFLEFDAFGRPTGHEGRHASIGASELGWEKIPVTIEHKRYLRSYEKEPDYDEEQKFGTKRIRKVLNQESYKEQPVDEEYLYQPNQPVVPKEMIEDYRKGKNKEREERLAKHEKRHIEFRNYRKKKEQERREREAIEYKGMTESEIEDKKDEERVLLLQITDKIEREQSDEYDSQDNQEEIK
jgi:hypothetical protein